MSKLIDLTGQKFGRLTVIGRAEKKGKTRQARWLCKCECGNTIEAFSDNLRSGHTKSCGCLNAEVIAKRSIKHGYCINRKHSRIYNTWLLMKNRCFNRKSQDYVRYGGRGIIVCDEWANDFEAFLDFVSKLPHYGEIGYSIDRIDVNGNYEPDNVRWATNKEQQNNRRNNRLITYNNETHTLSQWSEITGVEYFKLRHRLDSGWEIEKALTTK